MNELQLSYSSIKDFEILKPVEWHDKWINKNFPRETKRAFTFGSLLDCLLFEPELFDKRFIIADFDLPSDGVCDFVASVFNQLDQKQPILTLEDHSETVLSKIEERNYWANRKTETNLRNILKDGSAYFSLLRHNIGKTVVCQADVDKCLRMRENAWNHPEVRSYLIPEENVVLDFQKTLKVDYALPNRNVKIKCIFDGLFTNELYKIKKVVDLKSTANASGFSKSAEKYRYGAQMGLYCYALFKSLDGDKSWTIQPPSNIIVDKSSEQVFMYNYSWDDLRVERWGNEEIKGWHYLIEEIAKRYDTDNWNEEKV